MDTLCCIILASTLLIEPILSEEFEITSLSSSSDWWEFETTTTSLTSSSSWSSSTSLTSSSISSSSTSWTRSSSLISTPLLPYGYDTLENDTETSWAVTATSDTSSSSSISTSYSTSTSSSSSSSQSQLSGGFAMTSSDLLYRTDSVSPAISPTSTVTLASSSVPDIEELFAILYEELGYGQLQKRKKRGTQD